MSIQRYEHYQPDGATRCGCCLSPTENDRGRWVEYADHAAALAAKDVEIERLSRKLLATEVDFANECLRIIDERATDADERG